MTAVIAARFDSFAAADSAAHALFAVGVAPDRVNVFASKIDHPTSILDPQTDPEVWEQFEAPAAVAGLATMIAILCAAAVLAFQGSALAMLVAGALGAFLGAWVGARWMADRSRLAALRQEEARAMLTAYVGTEQFGKARELLEDAGATQVALSRGQWEHGRWYDDADPRDAMPAIKAASSGSQAPGLRAGARTGSVSKLAVRGSRHPLVNADFFNR